MGSLRSILLLMLGLSSRRWWTNASETEGWQPEQVHIAVGDTNEEMVISWVTTEPTPSSIVEFGTDGLDHIVMSVPKSFTHLGWEFRITYLHKVTLKDLLPDTRYYYHCGSEYGWSGIFTFKTWKAGTDWPVRVVMYGDLGTENPQSLPRLQSEVQKGMYDAIIHNGDFAYNLPHENGRVGDEFFKNIQPMASMVPYMTAPGNHEMDIEFRNYKNRFNMPNHTETFSYFYSWNMGPVHFIGINTEFYYLFLYFFGTIRMQYDWLINDLEEATKPENRAERPWIVLFGHRPMYCSTTCHDDCFNVNCRTRVGWKDFDQPGLEDLLYNYGVDLAVWAHEHSYERLWPIYDYTVMNGSLAEPYTNPPAPVHITTGSPGCKYLHDYFEAEQPEWSAVRLVDYGYTRLTVHNKTHLYFEQVSDEKDGEIVDNVWLVREKHGSFAEMNRNTSS